ncbi:hypothetical protein QTP88_018456 [Uroleucon formosanum]
MIPKPYKDHSLPINYRPTLLLSTLFKVFEKVLQYFLMKHIKPRAEQYSFRHGHSTTTQLVKLIDDLRQVTTTTDKQSHIPWRHAGQGTSAKPARKVIRSLGETSQSSLVPIIK